MISISLLLATWAQTWAVSPGEGLGPLTLSATRAEVAQVLTVSRDVEGSPFTEYSDGELVVFYQSGRAVMLLCRTSTLHTRSGEVQCQLPSGIAVGTPWSQAESELGPGYRTRRIRDRFSYFYPQPGIGFSTSRGIIQEISLWEAPSP